MGYWLKIEAEKKKMLISETETENNSHWLLNHVRGIEEEVVQEKRKKNENVQMEYG